MVRRYACGLLLSLAAACAQPSPAGQLLTRHADGGATHSARGDMVGADLACAGGGEVCTTANAGACAPGHIVCGASGPSCEPDVARQTCYTGPANTLGVGACVAGTQSCVGTLGPCENQVLPTTIENCFNDLDDDCDGVVNNGCPQSLTRGTTDTLVREGGAGGTANQLRCPGNSVVTRTVMYWDDGDSEVGGVDMYCSNLTLVRGKTSYRVTLAPVASTPSGSAVGSNASGTQDMPCDTTGFNLGAWITGKATPNAPNGNYVSAFGMSCSAGTLSLASDNTLNIDFAKLGMGTWWGYPSQPDPTFETDCPTGEVLVGYNVHIGFWMDAIQAVCAPLNVVYR